jgi:hypothetical protein
MQMLRAAMSVWDQGQLLRPSASAAGSPFAPDSRLHGCESGADSGPFSDSGSGEKTKKQHFAQLLPLFDRLRALAEHGDGFTIVPRAEAFGSAIHDLAQPSRKAQTGH